MSPIRLVTFDALHTLIIPRLPIHVQYSQVFQPYLGTLEPDSIKKSFKVALRTLQAEYPAYAQGSERWWSEVIRKTALAAGADADKLQASLPVIVRLLLKRFSSKEGYKAFDDTNETLSRLRNELGVATAVISNADSRLRSVLMDLEFPPFLDPIILSEEEGVEKPASTIFHRTIQYVNEQKLEYQKVVKPSECLHVGDELIGDYQGATSAGMHALLLRRLGPEGEQAHKETDESLSNVHVINGLSEVVNFVRHQNRTI
ncbi:hypothetical protein AMATHDRAFT_142395 [Amanita thiersii Skay4041]|uniref:Haloacid dehalogenase-like hydrolase domain-containing protein 3 n=1 Tax=Amanita thiersii Skay4041 TaxID=703135 RepID=A0A2A9NV79_9AGAR|nr:hypothetical protein AMATHDRAFT_142395 [Amanita thiersii Skay4041]